MRSKSWTSGEEEKSSHSLRQPLVTIATGTPCDMLSFQSSQLQNKGTDPHIELRGLPIILYLHGVHWDGTVGGSLRESESHSGQLNKKLATQMEEKVSKPDTLAVSMFPPPPPRAPPLRIISCFQEVWKTVNHKKHRGLTDSSLATTLPDRESVAFHWFSLYTWGRPNKALL